jgi:hypothetical protein
MLNIGRGPRVQAALTRNAAVGADGCDDDPGAAPGRPDHESPAAAGNDPAPAGTGPDPAGEERT